MTQATRRETQTEASEAVAAGPQLARQLFEAQSEFVKSLSEIDRPLMDQHQEAQQKTWAAYVQYAQSLQSNAGKADAVNEAFKTYSASVQEIQSGFQQRWKELAEQAVKQKSNSYREFIRKVQTAWRQVAVEQLTPAEAAMVGQSLVSLAILSQTFAHFE
jgi:hypothetical protein